MTLRPVMANIFPNGLVCVDLVSVHFQALPSLSLPSRLNVSCARLARYRTCDRDRVRHAETRPSSTRMSGIIGTKYVKNNTAVCSAIWQSFGLAVLTQRWPRKWSDEKYQWEDSKDRQGATKVGLLQLENSISVSHDYLRDAKGTHSIPSADLIASSSTLLAPSSPK